MSTKTKQKLPKWFNGECYTHGATVQNRFSGEEYELNNKILMRLLGETYKVTKHFVFGDYVSPLQPMMVEKFDEAYNNSQNW